MENIEQIVIECAAEAYSVEPDTIGPDTDIRNEISNQSLKLVAFISSIEDELNVTIDLGEAAELKTIRDFAEKVKALKS